MKYFVIKPTGDGPHGTASRQAMLAYSKSIHDHDPVLAAQLFQWANTAGAYE
jgi:hypothetical protein